MEYLVVSVVTSSQGCEILADALAGITGGCEVVDSAALGDMLRETRGRWDYVDEALLKPEEGPARVRFYLAGNEEGAAILREASQKIAQVKTEDEAGFFGPLQIEVAPMENQNWAESWKEYFKPVEIGGRLLVCPSWEQAEAGDRAVLRIDPSSSFGTGTHATTRMCLEQLEGMALEGKRVLDLGCGSGILSCAACLLGAEHALACDIEENAMRVTAETMAANGIKSYTLAAGNILDRGEAYDSIVRQGPYDVILANIVADVLIAMADMLPGLLKPGGSAILSGIINERAQEVRGAYGSGGLELTRQKTDDGWTMLVYNAAGI